MKVTYEDQFPDNIDVQIQKQLESLTKVRTKKRKLLAPGPSSLLASIGVSIDGEGDLETSMENSVTNARSNARTNKTGTQSSNHSNNNQLDENIAKFYPPTKSRRWPHNGDDEYSSHVKPRGGGSSSSASRSNSNGRRGGSVNGRGRQQQHSQHLASSNANIGTVNTFHGDDNGFEDQNTSYLHDPEHQKRSASVRFGNRRTSDVVVDSSDHLLSQRSRRLGSTYFDTPSRGQDDFDDKETGFYQSEDSRYNNSNNTIHRSSASGVNVIADCPGINASARLEDDVCCVCKDGGKLMLCDFPNCARTYHQVQYISIDDSTLHCIGSY